MERIGGENTGMPTSIRKVVVASFIGTTIEWYDYFIFVTAASLIFPGFGETTGTILSYTAFAVGFVARPVGGVIFVYIAAVCALSVVCYALASETYRKDIYEEEPAERQLVAEQQG
jgi:hypothetical protein